ncbi:MULTISPECIES: GNAT family N-acetyltransferase [Lactobacillaceae]|uniref:GNAT family N-acetyltransferase n=1 Tax=Lactobacillaceae TaxID=33958 RepID=UPI000C1B7A25|nr:MULTISPECIES: GNAT family N-acetyltransferase [Lactobacillaceae]
MEIRPLEERDLPFLNMLFNDKDIMGYWYEEPFESIEETENKFQKYLSDESKRRFVVEADDKQVGIVELVEIDNIANNCEIQVIIYKTYSGHGYAQLAMKLATEYAFNSLNLNKVYLYVDVSNEKAIHIYKKIGYQVEGQMREQFFSNGSYHDSYFMGILKSEFNKKDTNPD